MTPKKFNVADVHYTIVEKEFVEIAGSRNYQGACDYHTTTIEVLQELPFNRKNEVIIHELLHAIFNEAGYNEQDEEEITRVGRVLYQVLKNNDFSFLKGE
jgi:predicted metallopeptidase